MQYYKFIYRPYTDFVYYPTDVLLCLVQDPTQNPTLHFVIVPP